MPGFFHCSCCGHPNQPVIVHCDMLWGGGLFHGEDTLTETLTDPMPMLSSFFTGIIHFSLIFPLFWWEFFIFHSFSHFSSGKSLEHDARKQALRPPPLCKIILALLGSCQVDHATANNQHLGGCWWKLSGMLLSQCGAWLKSRLDHGQKRPNGVEHCHSCCG